MAGAGFKDFAVGEVLTAADVDQYLMQQSVMRFADAAARGSALGTAVLAEGMVSYLDDLNVVQVYDGSAWAGVGGFTAGTAITATDSSWTVPTLANPIVKVTVIGGGGGGASASGAGAGGAGGSSSFAISGTTVTGTGGLGGSARGSNGNDGTDGLSSANGGKTGVDTASDGNTSTWSQGDGNGGAITVAYLDMTGITTANVTIGAGGTGNTSGGSQGGDGGRGEVIFEYKAG